MSLTQYGATRAEWDWLLSRDLLEAMLPVVSNPNAKVASWSKLKSLGKVPSKIYSDGAGGIQGWPQHITTAEEVAAWRRHPDHGICMRTEVLPSIDGDINDQELAARIREMIDDHLPNLPTRGRDNSHKFLVAFRLDGPTPTKRTITTQHGIIEFLGTGQQFIAAGTHTSGVRYRWLPESPIFPTVSLADFERLWTALDEAFGIGDSLVDDVSRAPRAAIRNGAIDADPVAAWLVGEGKAHHIAADARIDITCPFESGHSTGEAGDTSTSYWPAHTGGFAGGAFVCLHASCKGRSQAAFRDAIGYREDSLYDFDPVAESGGAQGGTGDFDLVSDTPTADAVVAKPASKAERLPLVKWGDYADRPMPEYLIDDVLPEATVVILYGAPSSGKSFAAIEMAMCIARGTKWRDKDVKKGGVMYVAAEGQGGVAMRLRAYREYHDPDESSMVFMVMPEAPNMMKVEDVKLVMQRAVTIPSLKLIILDTLAQVSPGANENASEDMGMLLKHCQALHAKTGAVVMLVHHSGKDASKGLRGHSILNGNIDASLEVVADGDNRCLTITKMKDGEMFTEFPFRLNKVDLGKSAKGKAMSSCVVIHNNESPKLAKGPKGDNQKTLFRVFQALLRQSDDGKVSPAALWNDGAEQLIDKRTPEQVAKKAQDTRRQRAKETIDTLLAGKYIEEVAGWYVLPRVPVMIDEDGKPRYIEDMI